MSRLCSSRPPSIVFRSSSASAAADRPARLERANVRLLGERRERALADLGRDDHLGELLADDRFGGGLVERPVERDHAAERGSRVGAVRERVRAARASRRRRRRTGSRA